MNVTPIVLAAFFVFGFLTKLDAQPPTDTQSAQQRRTDLGERQRLIERKMAELEARFQLIAERLQATEPERAQRLVEAFHHANQTLIANRMQQITQLLDGHRLDEAEREMDAVIDHLEQLVRLLLAEQRDDMSKEQERALLEKWREQLRQLQREQQQQTQETSRLANRDQTLSEIDGQIEQLKHLIQQQNRLTEQSIANREGAAVPILDRMADEQFELRRETEQLARALDPARDKAAAETNVPAASQPQQPSTPGEQPTPAESGDQPPQPSQPGDAAAGQATPSAGQPAGARSPSGSSPSGAAQPKGAGQADVENAAEQQRSAEQQLDAGNPAEASRNQQRAAEELTKALEQLQQERRRIAALPPEAFEQMAQEQRQLQAETEELANEINQSPQPTDSPPDGGSPSGGKPGQAGLQQAQQSMGQAAENIDQQELQRAERQQQLAEEQLEQALREIEERLNQLRSETREERLARLETRFREMLSRQKNASAQTFELNDRRVYLGKWRPRDQLSLIRLTVDEMFIAELAQQAYDLLLEDGSSAVFPEMVIDLKDDLLRVAQLIEQEQTGGLTQLIQRDIETTLEDMLAALQQARRDQAAGGGGGGGGGGGQQPLLRRSAELKMLRAAQLRINHRTRQIERLRQTEGLQQVLGEEALTAAQRQAQISEIAQRLAEQE